LRKAALTALAFSAACSTGGHPLPRATPPAAISPAQSEEMADGKATFTEYQSAFRRYTACTSRAGFNVDVLGLSHQVYDYRLTAAAATSREVNHCYDYEFGKVDESWQVENQDHSETSEHLAACLTSKGITPKATVREMLAQLDAAGVDPTTCQ
jgi:endonuclease I